MTENDIGTAIIGAAIKVHSVVGPGLLESAYEACLVYELEKLRLRIRMQVMVRSAMRICRSTTAIASTCSSRIESWSNSNRSKLSFPSTEGSC